MLIFLAGLAHLIINFIPGYRGVLSSNIIEPVEEKHTRDVWNIANYIGYAAVYAASGLYVLMILALIYQVLYTKVTVIF